MKKIPFNEADTRIYKPTDIATVLELSVNEKNLTGNSKGEHFYNVPCSFDIETTSFYRDEDGTAYDYEQAQRLMQKRKIKLPTTLKTPKINIKTEMHNSSPLSFRSVFQIPILSP